MANFYRSFSKYMIERWSSLKAGSSSVFYRKSAASSSEERVHDVSRPYHVETIATIVVTCEFGI